MSTQGPLSGRMNLEVPEPYYESPVWRNMNLSLDEYMQSGQRRRSSLAGCQIPRFGSTSTTTSGSHTDSSQKGELTSPLTSIRDRITCYSWTWFTMTMATGGIANVLHSTPYQSEWLRVLGSTVFAFNLALFLTNAVLLTLKFCWTPGSFKASFISQSESLFISACVVSTGTILINICQYGIPFCGEWLQTTMQVCFWVYLCISVIASSLIYLFIWSTHSFPINTMTPIWIFPAYPLLLIAPLAANLIDALPSATAAARVNSIAIALAAVCIQGTGFLLSLMIYGAFIYRLMTQKLPQETRKPGMFVSVGPSGFTVAGIVHLGNIVETRIMPDGFMGDPKASFMLKIIASLTGLWLWGLCIWFCIVSIGAHWPLLLKHSAVAPRPSFDMTWYSYVFPNTAMVTASHQIAKAFDVGAIRIAGTTGSGLLVLLWLFVFGSMIHAFTTRTLLWPVKADVVEDKEKFGESIGGV